MSPTTVSSCCSSPLLLCYCVAQPPEETARESVSQWVWLGLRYTPHLVHGTSSLLADANHTTVRVCDSLCYVHRWNAAFEAARRTKAVQSRTFNLLLLQGPPLLHPLPPALRSGVELG